MRSPGGQASKAGTRTLFALTGTTGRLPLPFYGAPQQATRQFLFNTYIIKWYTSQLAISPCLAPELFTTSQTMQDFIETLRQNLTGDSALLLKGGLGFEDALQRWSNLGLRYP